MAADFTAYDATPVEKYTCLALATCPDHRMSLSEAGRLSVANLDARRAVFETIKREKLSRGRPQGEAAPARR
jgi:hypothetical protein